MEKAARQAAHLDKDGENWGAGQMDVLQLHPDDIGWQDKGTCAKWLQLPRPPPRGPESLRD